MEHKRDLFSNLPAAACPLYRFIHDAECERSSEAKKHCEDLWRDFGQHTGQHFLKEFPVQFHQRWFEMYLTVSLMRSNFDVKYFSGPSPDILLSLDGHRVWIEAICASPGLKGLPDSVSPIPYDTVAPVPIKQYVMRICNSLDSKAQKIEKYISEGIVGEDDLVVIAINVGGIPFLFADMDECVMRSLYGVGDLRVNLNTESRRIDSADRESVSTIHKTSNSPIGVQPFVDSSMKHISLVLASSVNAVAWPLGLGDDFVLYPNLTCTNRWPESLISLGIEWLFEENRNGWVGKKLRHSN